MRKGQKNRKKSVRGTLIRHTLSRCYTIFPLHPAHSTHTHTHVHTYRHTHTDTHTHTQSETTRREACLLSHRHVGPDCRFVCAFRGGGPHALPHFSHDLGLIVLAVERERQAKQKEEENGRRGKRKEKRGEGHDVSRVGEERGGWGGARTSALASVMGDAHGGGVCVCSVCCPPRQRPHHNGARLHLLLRLVI